jgi:hypothetical protein
MEIIPIMYGPINTNTMALKQVNAAAVFTITEMRIQMKFNKICKRIMD